MIKKQITSLTLLIGLGSITPAFAYEDMPAPSFVDTDANSAVTYAIDTMTSWAAAEYTEHEQEGLFKRYPEDGQITQATIAIAKELKQKAETANKAGETIKARSYYFAAEAAARYAVQMPHMLEDRVKELAQP